MQTKSDLWRETFKSGTYRVESKLVMGGVEYPVAQPDTDTPSAVSACKVSRKLWTADKLIGNACSAMLTLSIVPTVTPPTMAEIDLLSRLVAPDGSVSEYIKQGTFFIDERPEDYFGILNIVAYDAMMKAEEPYYPTGSAVTGTWPVAAPDVVRQIASRIGVTADITGVSTDISVPTPLDLTMRDVLCYIAAGCGGNFTVTKDGVLRLVLLPAEIDRAYLVDQDANNVADELGNKIIIADGDYRRVGNICESFSKTGRDISATKLTLTVSSDTGYSSGSDGYEVTATCPYATQAITDAALANLSGKSWTPFEASGCRLDPAAELGDAIYVAGSFSAIGDVETEYSLATMSIVKAPAQGDVSHEFPYLTQMQKEITRETNAVRAELKINTDSIESQVTGLQGEQTSIKQSVDSINLGVSNGDDSSSIYLIKDGVVVSSKTIQFTGGVVFKSDLSSGNTTINGGCIQTGEVSADHIKLGGQMDVYESVSSTTSGGYLGYMSGQSATGEVTVGIGAMHSPDTGQMLCSSAGARLGYGSSTAIVCGGSNVALYTNADITMQAGGAVVVQSQYLRPTSSGSAYCGSYSYHWGTGYIDTLYTSDGTVSKSDRRAKKHISDNMGRYLELFDRLRPVHYVFRKRKRTHLGFIAQDVEQAMQECGIDSKDFAGLIIDEHGGYGLRYEEFTALLTAKVQEQDKKIKELEARLDGK